MARLLTDEDVAFVASHSIYSAKMIRQLRAERRKIFRAYLDNLVADFERLHVSARLLLIHSDEDRPDLAATLVRQKLLFTLAVVAVKARLALHAFGLTTVNVDALLTAADQMRAAISVAMPASETA